MLDIYLKIKNEAGSASGFLYVDDGETFNHQK